MRDWLKDRPVAKGVLTVLLVVGSPVLVPLFAIGFLVAVAFGGAYDSIDDWANRRQRKVRRPRMYQ